MIVRGILPGVIAFIACGLGMMVMVHTHLRLNNAFPSNRMGIRVFLAGIPWAVGVGEGLLAMVVYRLALKSPSLWLWVWFIVWLMASGFVIVDFVHWLGGDAYVVLNFVGFPSMMIMGLWMMVFAALLVNRRWPPVSPPVS